MARTEEVMSEAEYLVIQQQLLMLASLVREMDVEGFLKCISLSEATAPILDPTLWIKGHKNLEIIKKMALGARAFKNALPPVPSRSREGEEDDRC